MKNSRKLSQIADEIRSRDSFLIFAHKNPDGDAVGSAVSMGLLLKSLGKKVSYAVNRDNAGLWSIFEEGSYFGEPVSGYYDFAVAVDCSTSDFIDCSEHLSRCSGLIVIDHHVSNKGYGDISYIDSDASAAGEIIYELFKIMDIPVSRQAANALFLSLSSDTGYFRYSNTKPSTHMTAAELYKYSDEFTSVAEFADSYDLSKTVLIKEALSSMEFYYEGKLGIISLTRESGVLSEDTDTDGIIDYIRNVRGCRLAVLIKETEKGCFKISMRSTASDYDISVIAAAFGGGGHKKAAGFFMSDTNLKEVTDTILRTAKGIWTE